MRRSSGADERHQDRRPHRRTGGDRRDITSAPPGAGAPGHSSRPVKHTVDTKRITLPLAAPELTKHTVEVQEGHGARRAGELESPAMRRRTWHPPGDTRARARWARSSPEGRSPDRGRRRRGRCSSTKRSRGALRPAMTMAFRSGPGRAERELKRALELSRPLRRPTTCTGSISWSWADGRRASSTRSEPWRSNGCRCRATSTSSSASHLDRQYDQALGQVRFLPVRRRRPRGDRLLR